MASRLNKKIILTIIVVLLVLLEWTIFDFSLNIFITIAACIFFWIMISTLRHLLHRNEYYYHNRD